MARTLMWLVPVWTLAVALFIAFFTKGRYGKPGRWLAVAMALMALIPWLPSSQAEPRRKPATQVIYRFDDHRYLTMTGYGCEGAIYYVDEKRKMRSTYMDQFARVFLPRIVHADDDGDFIFVPYADASGFAVSKDHGETFQDASWVGTRPYAEEIKQITVVNRQAFIETKDGRLFMTSKPFGEGWGMNVINIKYLPQTTLAEWPNFQKMPTRPPPVKNYKGWTEMHCDPDLQGEPVSTPGSSWNVFQKQVLAILGNTVALPVTWALRQFKPSPTA